MTRSLLVAGVGLVLAWAGGCSRARTPAHDGAVAASPPAVRGDAVALADGAAPASAPALRQTFTPHQRVVAVGDLHGDLQATRAALRLAGAIDASDAWIGGDLVVVQTGDVLDRGDDEPAIEDLLDREDAAATRAGGRVIVLLGNHELMNARADFRYVTRGGFATYHGSAGRTAAFAPGGPEARRLAHHSLYALVGTTLFAHGGVLPEHLAAGLDRLDAATQAWLDGQGPAPPAEVLGNDGIVWTRRYGTDVPDCAALADVLAATGAHRIVVGHTSQEHGATSACDGRLWRIDVGLAAPYGGPIEVLAVDGDDVGVMHAARPASR